MEQNALQHNKETQTTTSKKYTNKNENRMAIPIIEDINQFKRDLKTYKYYQMKIQNIDAKLVEMEDRLTSISAIQYDRMHQKNGHYKNRIVEFICIADELKIEKQKYVDFVSALEYRLTKIAESDRQLLINIYIHNKRFEDIADEYHYSIRKMKSYVEQLIKKILKEK